MTSVALTRPRSRSEAAARLEEKPWLQMTMTRTSWFLASGMREGEVGSSRHSKTVRSTTSAPGISPSRARCSEVRARDGRSEEHTSELQSRGHLVCRLLLEKKKKKKQTNNKTNT